MRPLIREQAFGEALDAGKLEQLGRYEVHLDRKLERMLASGGAQTNPTASHYYSGYWAGVQAGQYGGFGAAAGAFAGALIGMRFGGAFGAAFGAEEGSVAGAAIEAIGVHVVAAIGQHFGGGGGGVSAGTGGSGANDNIPGGPPFGGGRPPDWMPSSGPGAEAWNALSSGDKDLVWLAHNPDARNWDTGMRNWLTAIASPALPSLGENNIYSDMLDANGLLGRDGTAPWFSPLLDMRLPDYRQATLDQLNAGELNTIGDPTYSIRPIPIVDWYLDFNQSGRAIAMRNLVVRL